MSDFKSKKSEKRTEYYDLQWPKYNPVDARDVPHYAFKIRLVHDLKQDQIHAQSFKCLWARHFVDKMPKIKRNENYQRNRHENVPVNVDERQSIVLDVTFKGKMVSTDHVQIFFTHTT